MPRDAFRFGAFGALAPLLLFLVGATYLGLSGAPDERGLWPILLAALLLGTLLARDPNGYAEAAVRYVAQPVIVLMLLAWILAGAFGAILRASGLVDSLVYLGALAGLSGGLWVGASFLAGALLSTSTGTSLGTLILAVPLLYPAGLALGADPIWLLAALLGGATFGDNLSPVSDTTIASATTQHAAIREVVRSRLRYALPAAGAALILFSLFGASAAPAGSPDTDPTALVADGGLGGLEALWMLLAPALVIGLLLRGAHLVVGLLWGIAAACLLGLFTGRIAPAQLLSLDRDAFVARSLLLDGVAGSAGLCLVTVLLMALVGGFETSGLLQRLLSFSEARVASLRGAEWASFGAVSAATLLTTHSGVAILTVGDVTRRLGERFGVPPTRRANLLDLAVCTYPFLLPWFIPTLLTSALARSSSGSSPGPLPIGLANLYSWLLLSIAVFAITTGWGRAHGERGPTRQAR